MITLFPILAAVASILSEETQEEADARVLAEAKAYVAGLSDEEFEAWVVNMEKMGRFLEIAKIMRVEWLVERLQGLLTEAMRGMRFYSHQQSISVETLKSNSKIFEKYWLLFKPSKGIPVNLEVINNGNALILSQDSISGISYYYAMDIDGFPCDDTRTIVCMNAGWAYLYARDVDKTPRDDTRAAACMESNWSYQYAKNIDKSPCDDTRAACTIAPWAYYYAEYVDKTPRDDTRAIACAAAEWAYRYARNVDTFPRDDTRTAACMNADWAFEYAKDVDKSPNDETRAAACMRAGAAYYYAKIIDESPRDDTRAAASSDEFWVKEYNAIFGKKP